MCTMIGSALVFDSGGGWSEEVGTGRGGQVPITIMALRIMTLMNGDEMAVFFISR